MDDFRATADINVLKIRASLLQQTRRFFDSRGLIEVQTPVLSSDTVVDRHIDPVPVLMPSDPFDLATGREMWLQTSPEFGMKRLLASGAEAIYQIGPVFRVGESGSEHNPEFTMLEWYRCGDSMAEGIELLSAYVAELLECPPATVLTIQAAFESLAGFDPFGRSASDLRRKCQERNVSVPSSINEDDWDTWFDLLFSTLVQPNLGEDAPTIIHDYPASQAALAKVRRGDPDVAERFELFVGGVELANGYHELLAADELVRRNQAVNQQRTNDGKLALPVESRLLDAMRSGLPACTGVAVGFDRLCMLSVGAETLDQVMPFPISRA